MVTWMDSWMISSIFNSFLLNVRRANLVSSKKSKTNLYSFKSEAFGRFLQIKLAFSSQLAHFGKKNPKNLNFDHSGARNSNSLAMY